MIETVLKPNPASSHCTFGEWSGKTHFTLTACIALNSFFHRQNFQPFPLPDDPHQSLANNQLMVDTELWLVKLTSAS